MGLRATSDRRVAWGVALALFGLTMLCWSGTFHSSDGLSAYAVADSLTRYGRFATEQVRWLGFQQGMYGPNGLLYSQKGPAISLMALPLTVAGMMLPGLGPVHTSLVLGPLVTAASGALLYLAGRRAFPSLPRSATVLSAFAWGLGSLAWPYSKTFFSEPVAAFATIGALERLLALADSRAGSRQGMTTALGLGCWLGLGILARPAHAVVVPIFLLALVYIAWRDHGSEFSRSYLVVPLSAAALPVLVAGALSLWYNWARFGHPLVTGYLPEESFSAIWWQGLAGLSISPGRGLLWYAPWAVMAVAGLPLAWRLSKVATVTSAALCLAYLLLYSKWHLWHGGYCWGPRFLVPILPLLGLLAVAAVARWQRLFRSLVALGVGVNLIGVAWDFDQHQQALLDTGLRLFDPRTLFDPRYAQIPGVWRLGRWEALDVAWIVEGRPDPTLVMLALALATTGVLGGLLVASSRRMAPRKTMLRKRAINPWWVVCVLTGITYAFLWQAGRIQPAGYRRIAAAVAAHSSARTMVWNNDHPHISTFLNLYRGRAMIVGVHEPNDELSLENSHRLTALSNLPQSVWVIDRGPVGSAGVLERTAAQNRGLVQEASVATSTYVAPGSPQDSAPLKAMLYFGSTNWRVRALDVTFGSTGKRLIRLEEAGLSGEAGQEGVIAVRLVWELQVPEADDLQVRVRLLSPDGKQMGLDVGLLDEKKTVTHLHAFSVPADADSGEYEFAVAVHDLSTGLTLRTSDGHEEFDLGPVSVIP